MVVIPSYNLINVFMTYIGARNHKVFFGTNLTLLIFFKKSLEGVISNFFAGYSGWKYCGILIPNRDQSGLLTVRVNIYKI